MVDAEREEEELEVANERTFRVRSRVVLKSGCICGFFQVRAGHRGIRNLNSLIVAITGAGTARPNASAGK